MTVAGVVCTVDQATLTSTQFECTVGPSTSSLKTEVHVKMVGQGNAQLVCMTFSVWLRNKVECRIIEYILIIVESSELRTQKFIYLTQILHFIYHGTNI